MAYVTWGKITLTKKLNPGDTTLYANADLGINAGRLYLVNDNQVEWIDFTGKSLVGSDWAYTGLTRQLSQTSDPAVSVGSGFTWLAVTEAKVVAMHDQLPDRRDGMKVAVYADAAARDAAIGSPSNGMSCYLTAEGVFSDYQSWAWADRANGATPNASPTVAGKVETSTDAQITASTDTGETGALLHVLPSQVNKIVSLATADTVTDEADYFVISDTSDGGKNKKIVQSDLRNALAASTSAKGTAQTATSAEVIAGADSAKYVTPAGLAAVRNRYLSSWTTSGSWTVTFTHGLGRVPKVVRIYATNASGLIQVSSEGKYDGTTYACAWISETGTGSDGYSPFSTSSAIAVLRRDDNGGSTPDQSAWTVTTFDATSVVVTKTISNTDPGTIAYTVEIE